MTGNIGVDNTGEETVSVLMGRPGGTFAPAVTYYAPYDYEGPGLTGLAVGDADGDGDLDLLTSSRGSNDAAFYENRGDGTFAFRYRYGLGERASSLVYADVTGDGFGDLLSITYGYEAYSPHLTLLRGRAGAVTPSEPGVPPEGAGVRGLALSEGRPNPFSARTTLTLSNGREGAVTVAVFDALGRRVATLHDGPLAAGTHALTLDAAALPAGVYVVRAWGDGVAVARRLVVVR